MPEITQQKRPSTNTVEKLEDDPNRQQNQKKQVKQPQAAIPQKEQAKNVAKVQVTDSQQTQADLLEVGTLLKNNTYQITKRLGAGGFGSIYEAVDLRTQQPVAVKAETLSSKWPFLMMEVDVLQRMQGKPNIATFHACGRHYKCNYIVMQLLGRNLQEIRKSRPQERFTMATCFLVCQEMLQGVQSVHESGYIHRDLKPGNFAADRNEQVKTIYIFDFGLCRPYRDNQGMVKPPRHTCGFRGTVRYASINIHQGKDMGRSDDIASLFYILLEMLTGRLPWNRLQDKGEILAAKRNADIHSMIAGGPTGLTEFYEIVSHLEYHHRPPYERLKNILQTMLNEKNINRETFEYDWVRPPPVKRQQENAGSHRKHSPERYSVLKKLPVGKANEQRSTEQTRQNYDAPNSSLQIAALLNGSKVVRFPSVMLQQSHKKLQDQKIALDVESDGIGVKGAA